MESEVLGIIPSQSSAEGPKCLTELSKEPPFPQDNDSSSYHQLKVLGSHMY